MSIIIKPKVVNSQLNNKYLVIEPTFAPGDIHIRAGGVIDESNCYLTLSNKSVSPDDIPFSAVSILSTETSDSTFFWSQNQIQIKNSTKELSPSTGGELPIYHGNNVTYDVFARKRIGYSSTTTISFSDSENFFNQFTTIECFIQATEDIVDRSTAEALNYTVVYDGNTTVVGQEFNRIRSSGISSLVSIGCTYESNVINLSFTNVNSSEIDIFLTCQTIGLRGIATINTP